MLVLRPYQTSMVDRALAHLTAGLRGVLVLGATGSGKGDIITHFVQLAVQHRRPAVFAVHLGEIVRDVRDRIISSGVEPGLIRTIMGSESEGADDALVTVASWQTLAARELALPAALFLSDEAQRSKSATALAVLDRHRQAALLGFTATGQRGDGSGLGPVGYQAIVAGPQIQELVDASYLASVRVLAPDSFTDELAEDPVTAYLTEALGRPAIFFCSSLTHSKEVASGLRARGVRAAHVDSDTRPDDRKRALAQLESGELDCITNFRLFTEGLNVRRISCVVLASAFSHDGPYLQSIGRGRRPFPGKDLALILDLRGNIHRRGHPDEDRTYHLEGTAVRRVAALPAVVQCRSCLGWATPSSKCRICGARLPPPKPPRITKKELREQKLARVKREGKQWDEWCALVNTQRERGYKPQWAAFRWKQTHGFFPRFTVAMVPEMPRALPAPVESFIT